MSCASADRLHGTSGLAAVQWALTELQALVTEMEQDVETRRRTAKAKAAGVEARLDQVVEVMVARPSIFSVLE